MRTNRRLKRIECKCDRILAELLIIRNRLSRKVEIDTTIEVMHETAKRLRNQCKKEKETIAKWVKR